MRASITPNYDESVDAMLDLVIKSLSVPMTHEPRRVLHWLTRIEEVRRGSGDCVHQERRDQVASHEGEAWSQLR